MVDELIGRTLGQYTLKSLLGKGGMAKVYVADQPSIQREVAVKVMSGDLADSDEFVARFKREANVIAQLQHPHILPVIDFGQEGSLVYIVMRLVSGGTLDQHVRHGALPLDRALEILKQIGSALAFAHQQGIIHRDLKPNNVLLDEQGNVYLADFGLAKMLGGGTELTETHSVLGTPSYMSPEQWRAEAVDERADIYSLGVMTYQMLTGQLPFSADTPYQMMHHHMNTPPPPLPRLPVSSTIEPVIFKALAKSPADRFQSVAQMMKALAGAGDVNATQSDSAEMLFDTVAGGHKLHVEATMIGEAEATMDTIDETALLTHTTLAPPIPAAQKPVGRTSLIVGGIALVAVVLIAVAAVLLASGGDESENEEPEITLLTEPVIEDFETNTVGWDRIESNRYLDEGRYHTMTLPGEGGSGLALAQSLNPVADFRLEVDLEDLSETSDQVTYGVLFRVQDTSNYYRFTVTNNGLAGVIKLVEGEESILPLTTIYGWNPGIKRHTLKAEMVGAEMVLYVDNQVVLRDSDSSLPEPGGVGVAVFREGAHVAWDNLRITPIAELTDPLVLAAVPYQDSFEENTCQWADNARMDNTTVAFLEDGRYNLQVPETQQSIQVRCATLGLYQDMRLSVMAHRLNEDDTPTAYGVAFRQNADASSYYVFVINDRGQASLQKHQASDPECQPCVISVEAVPGYLATEPHLITIEALGDDLRGYVDGELVLEVEDASIPEPGIIRLGAYLPEAHVVFDDLLIQPVQPLPAPVVSTVQQQSALLVLDTPAIDIGREAGVDTAIMLAKLPLNAPLENFVLSGTLRFETELNDYCGIDFRSFEQKRFQWLHISRAGAFGFGDEVNMPNDPLMLQPMSSTTLPETVEVIVVAQGGVIELFVDGESVKEVVSETEPIAGDVFLWVVVSADHNAACHLSDVQVWSLD